MSLVNTPRASQLHIGIFGKRNSGKSTLMNHITRQDISVVSEVLGTTTDLVYKTMEVYGIGPCVFIDTAGFDDEGDMGQLRMEKTEIAFNKTELAILLVTSKDITLELSWVEKFKHKNIPYLILLNKVEQLENQEEVKNEIERVTKEPVVAISLKSGFGTEEILPSLIRKLPEDYDSITIVGNLVGKDDMVLLVMPQDIQAPKGRLILPQVQTLRELLDKKCMILSCTTDNYQHSLRALVKPPKLIITDSQIFSFVYEHKPKESLITSFSVLFANYKGDMEYYKESVKVINKLTKESKVLIAEACTHAPLQEDIGRVKIPRMLRNKVGEQLQIDIASGIDFPKDLTSYDLIIHCGACMFNRKYVLNRIEEAKKNRIPMTNYGVVIAYLSGILKDVVY